MERVIEILKNIKEGIDFTVETGLISGHILDSIDVTTLISELETEFDIEITMEYMDNDNFDSAEAIWEMIQEIQEG